MARTDDVDVSETGSYKAHTEGPARDTHAFHNDTPAPGERTVFDDRAPPPQRRPSTISGTDLPRIPTRRNTLSEIASAAEEDGLTPPVLIAGVGALIFALLAGGMAVGLAWFGSNDEPPPPPPEVEELEGIPVRKDLNK